MTDSMVHSPPHYNAYSIEVIEVTRYCSFNIGNAIKYMLRHTHKGASQQDLEKALWYLSDHITHSNDEGPVIKDETAKEELMILAKEYLAQDDSIPAVGAALAFITVDAVDLARMSLEIALSKSA